MFFSRQWRERVERLDKAVTEFEAQREVYERALLRADQRYDSLLAAHRELQESFQKVADQYTEGLARARKTIEELDEKLAEAPTSFRSEPLHMTEEEEDAQFMLDAGVINMDEYNRILEQNNLAD